MTVLHYTIIDYHCSVSNPVMMHVKMSLFNITGLNLNITGLDKTCTFTQQLFSRQFPFPKLLPQPENTVVESSVFLALISEHQLFGDKSVYIFLVDRLDMQQSINLNVLRPD